MVSASYEDPMDTLAHSVHFREEIPGVLVLYEIAEPC